jgi:hydroxyacylglutathione hydrolase
VFYPRLKKSNQKADVPVRHRPIPRAMPAKEFFELSEHGNEDARIVDLRSIAAFAGAHVKNALNIGLGKSFPNWAGWTLRPEHNIYLIANEPGEAEIEMATRHLYRLGIDNVKGFLAGGMKAWFMAGLPFQKLEQISVHDLKKSLDGPEKWTPLDVRSPAEVEEDKLPHAEHCWLPELMDQKCDLPKDQPFAVYCGSGYRASLGASQMQIMGFEDVGVVPGSYAAWNKAGYETVETN